MTEDYNPTDNAIAERFNGILKTESIYPQKQLPTKEQACDIISRFIHFYNNERPHMSLGYKTPAEVHMEQGMQRKMWKEKKYKQEECQQ